MYFTGKVGYVALALYRNGQYTLADMFWERAKLEALHLIEATK